MKKKIKLSITFFLILFSLNTFSQTLESNPEKITIYWDASYSLKDKNILKEIDFLNNYFNHVSNTKVELVSFSNIINATDTFDIINSDWTLLKNTLLEVKYDGVSYFNVLQGNTSDISLFFTDGLEIIDELKIDTVTPTYVINSSQKSNNPLLKAQSTASGGDYIDLNSISLEEGLAIILGKETKTVLIDKSQTQNGSIIVENTEIQKETGIISGTVFSDEGILIGATITIKEKSSGVVTDVNGKFKIKAEKGDVLVIRYVGKYPKEITIEDSTELDIPLINDVNELKEIEVSGGRINEKEEIDLGGRKVEKRKLGYAVQSIKGSDLTDARAGNLSLQGKISGVSHYGQNDDISQIVLRANSIMSNVFPLIVIDGTPVRRSSSAGRLQLSSFIDPNNIANINILKGLAATNRWGSEGSNGVILITTKANDFSDSGNKKPYDKALLRDNDYNEELTLAENPVDTDYIEELKKHESSNNTYDFYLNQRNDFLNDFQYFTNVSAYFNESNKKAISTRILSNILENNSDNIATMRFVAYRAEQQQDYIFARGIFEKILKLRPNESQSYKDIALIYQKTEDYQKALDIYNKIVSNQYPGVNFSGLKKLIVNDMKRMIILHKKKIKLKKISSEYTSTKKFDYDARIVFDWNNREAEFELQFVNPQKKFFTWSHTKEKNAGRISKEHSQGFSSEEFLLINAEKGEWIINIESNAEKNKNPIAIKYTVYRNFGEANETIESKLLLFNDIKGKQMLGKIIIKK